MENYPQKGTRKMKIMEKPKLEHWQVSGKSSKAHTPPFVPACEDIKEVAKVIK